MLRKQIVPDKVLHNKVTQRLARAGMGAGCSLRVSVKNGQVTLSGTILRDLQRRPALRAAQGIDGVRQVIDQLKVEAKKVWKPKKVDEQAKSVNVEPEAPSAEAEEETDAPTSA
ncbi:MAG: BON domain-containing protein [Planctomycetaceae bacterium]|nr:BON domain-containing protein [Planctomycetaceae bacterium]